MNATDLDLARLAELAVERWLEGLAYPESMEFETLRARYPNFAVDSLEDVAAALRVGLAGSPIALPERVLVKLAKGADDYFGPKANLSGSVRVNDLDRVSTIDRGRFWFAYSGWLTAAASVLLSITLWTKRPAVEVARTVTAPSAASITGEAPASPRVAAADLEGEHSAEGAHSVEGTHSILEPKPSIALPAERTDSAIERAQFMRTHAWLLQRAWLPGPDPTGEAVSGDVVWDAKSQTGYMRFHRLRRNDPNVEQYQLWIFDARRDERFPVDGGVFNVSDASGDEVVRFAAQLNVEVPLMFVVTVERRGGVVVSDRSRVSAIAHTS